MGETDNLKFDPLDPSGSKWPKLFFGGGEDSLDK